MYIGVMTTLGDMVLAARTDLGLTQDEFGKRVGVSHSYIYNLEKGKNQIPSPGVLEALARVIGVSKIELLRAVGYLGDDDIAPTDPAVADVVNGFTEDELAHVRRELASDPHFLDTIAREVLRRRR